ncbi:hypothetical protein [Sphingopyxis sp. DBS4]|uniref:hypothetical protein n=1 Tax=Sphingopyxis sp. DBS4 TaxID=2968500 RepID=UPI00214BF12E|nr:hypothetical protein [Sphingopyxis sp. DBS4]
MRRLNFSEMSSAALGTRIDCEAPPPPATAPRIFTLLTNDRSFPKLFQIALYHRPPK